ncbi:hypothetical protein [Mycoplasmopsis iners]|uniref:hypothetical protein n=1 Tax=Mycoplasmopsis iners TaxID=76630 RepID=UPI0004969D0E|nr:hypothetical protein [Mycoplasmopsis iners]
MKKIKILSLLTLLIPLLFFVLALIFDYIVYKSFVSFLLEQAESASEEEKDAIKNTVYYVGTIFISSLPRISEILRSPDTEMGSLIIMEILFLIGMGVSFVSLSIANTIVIFHFLKYY